MGRVYLLHKGKVIGMDTPAKEVTLPVPCRHKTNQDKADFIFSRDEVDKNDSEKARKILNSLNPEETDIVLSFISTAETLAHMIDIHDYTFNHVLEFEKSWGTEIVDEFWDYPVELKRAIKVLCRDAFLDQFIILNQ